MTCVCVQLGLCALLFASKGTATECTTRDQFGDASDICHDDGTGVMFVQTKHRANTGTSGSLSDLYATSRMTSEETRGSKCPRFVPPVSHILGLDSGATFGLFSITKIALTKPPKMGKNKYYVQIEADPDLTWTFEDLELTGTVLSLNAHVNVPFNTTVSVVVKQNGLFHDSTEAQFEYEAVENVLQLSTSKVSGGTCNAVLRQGQGAYTYVYSDQFRNSSFIQLPDNLWFRSFYKMVLRLDLIKAFTKFGYLLDIGKGVLAGMLRPILGYDTFLAGYSAMGYSSFLGMFPRAHTCDAGNLGTIAAAVEIISVNYAKTFSQNMGQQIGSGNFNRGQSLTPVSMGYGWWPEPANHAIILGYTAADHGFVRPWLMKWFGNLPSNLVEKYGTRFWNTRQQKGTAKTEDLKLYGLQCLFEIAFDMDFKQSQLDPFISKQMATVGEYSLNDFPTGFIDKLFNTTEFKETLMKDVKVALAKKYKGEFTSLTPYDRNLLGAAAVDSLVWAGGLSMGSVMMNTMSALLGEEGQAAFGPNFTVTSDNSAQLIYEIARSVPPVGGFGVWSAVYNVQIWMDLFMIGTDTSVWGRDATSLKLHPLDMYKKNSVNWAQQALVDGNWSHPNSHACPGYELSILIMRSFAESFQAAGGSQCWEWDGQGMAPTLNNGFVPIPVSGFTINYKEECKEQ